MRKRLREFGQWLWAFIKDYVPWTGMDQFLDSTWGKGFLATLRITAVTASLWLISHLAALSPAWKGGLLGAFIATAVVAVAILFFSPTSPKFRKPKPKSPYISGEGFFDSMVNMQIAQKAFLKAMDRITQTHIGLTSKINNHTAAIEKIKRSGRDVFARMRRESLGAAQSTNDASNEFEKVLPELAESASVYFDGQLQLVSRADATNPGQRVQLEKLCEVVGNLRKTNAGARDSHTFYLNTLAGAKGFAGELDTAVVRMSEKVTETIQIANDVETRCDAIIAAIESKLAKAAS